MRTGTGRCCVVHLPLAGAILNGVRRTKQLCRLASRHGGSFGHQTAEKLKDRILSSPLVTLRRAAVLLCAVVALLAAIQAFQGAEVALGQSDAGCEAIELGSLGAGEGDILTASGRWTGEDCDSRLFTNCDAHNYSFSLLEGGQVRVELSSDEGDSYLQLLTSEGSRIADDDDSGQGLDSRIERDLSAGDYLIEAASAVGRDSGPADFTLTVTRPTNCGPTDMGSQEAGAGLIFSGAWTGEDCGATFREDTPAQTFRFSIADEGLERIDLTAPVGGDPYLYLLSSDGAYLYSDDDGRQGRNSRVENDLAPAPTWSRLQPTAIATMPMS